MSYRVGVWSKEESDKLLWLFSHNQFGCSSSLVGLTTGRWLCIPATVLYSHVAFGLKFKTLRAAKKYIEKMHQIYILKSL